MPSLLSFLKTLKADIESRSQRGRAFRLQLLRKEDFQVYRALTITFPNLGKLDRLPDVITAKDKPKKKKAVDIKIKYRCVKCMLGGNCGVLGHKVGS